jgi:dipeptide/tripeptide permease
VDALLSFAATLVSLRLVGPFVRSRRYAWAGGVLSFGAATAALAWGSAHGWDAPSFRVYYLAGALLSAPLLGIGSLSLAGKRWAAPLGLLYAGFAVGVAIAMPVHGEFHGTAVPHAQDHLDTLERVVAIVASSVGTIAVVAVAFATLRRRPLGNALVVAAVATAATASVLTQTAVAAAAALFAVAAALLYAAVRA